MAVSPATADHAVTFAEFARLAGFRRSYVTQLRKDGRLVLNERGRIVVDATLARIQATSDPSKAGVAERHAAQRQAKAQKASAADEQPADDDAPELPATTPASMSYQEARAIKERYQAMAAKRDYEISMQQLLNAEDVRQAVLGAITTLRSRLETMPDTLGPQVAAVNDEGRARAILADAMQHALGEVSRDFQQLGGMEQ